MIQKVTIKKALNQFLSELEDRFEKSYLNGILEIGFPDENTPAIGFLPGELAIFQSQVFDKELLPTMAYTLLSSFLINDKRRVLIFNGQIPVKDYVERLVAQVSKVSALKLLWKNLGLNDWVRLAGGVSILSKSKVTFCDSARGFIDLKDELAQLSKAMERDLDCLVFHINQKDYQKKDLDLFVRELKDTAEKLELVSVLFIHSDSEVRSDSLPLPEISFATVASADKIFTLKSATQNEKFKLEVFPVSLEIKYGSKIKGNMVHWLNKSLCFKYNNKRLTLEYVAEIESSGDLPDKVKFE